MNLPNLFKRLFSGGASGTSRLAGAVLLVLVLAYSVLTGQLPDGLSGSAPKPSATPPATVQARSGQSLQDNGIAVAQLPPEGQRTLALIRKGGPYPYAKDGTVFGNREGLLPRQRRGYYTEYTVPTPNVSHRGARRIVAGGSPGPLVEFYYTDDHYRSFRKIKVP